MSKVPLETRRPYSIWDGPRCLHTGSVVAPSDADGLRSVLGGVIPVPMDVSRHYRVRCGGAVASVAGGECARTADSSSMPGDAAGEQAKAERERVEAEAKRLLEKTLADKLKGRETFTERLKRLDEEKAAAGGIDGRHVATHPLGPRPGSCFNNPHGYHDVRELEVHCLQSVSAPIWNFQTRWECRACRKSDLFWTVMLGSTPSPSDFVDAARSMTEFLEREQVRAAVNVGNVLEVWRSSPRRVVFPVGSAFGIYFGVHVFGGGGGGGPATGAGTAGPANSAVASGGVGSGNAVQFAGPPQSTRRPVFDPLDIDDP